MTPVGAMPQMVPGDGLPNSPDMLTDIACSVTKASPITFAGEVIKHIAGNAHPQRATSGAWEMSHRWSALFAHLTNDQADRTAQRWALVLDPGATKEVVERGTAVVLAVRDVCRAALERNASVVYSWTL